MAVSKMMLRAVLVVAGLAMASAALKDSCPKGSTAVKYPGQDIMTGKNLSSSHTNSEEDCLAKCTKDRKCNSAVLLTRDNGAKTCYLKSGAVGTRKAALNNKKESQSVINKRFVVLACVKATAPRDGCPASTEFKRFSGFDVSSGVNLAKITKISRKECDKECEDNHKCNSSVYLIFPNPKQNACYLKSAKVEARKAVSKSEASRFTLSGCAKKDGVVKPVDPPTNGKCVGGLSGGNQCAGNGFGREVAQCCSVGSKRRACFAISHDFAQCRTLGETLPSRFTPGALDVGTYGSGGPTRTGKY